MLDFDPGSELGGYRILRRLGTGGMAVVFEAQDPKLDRRVALKVLKPHLGADPAQVRRFEHEAQAAARLIHPNIVQTFDVGQANGCHFIAQEYISGSNLSRLLQQRGPLPIPTVVAILRQVALALHKAAEHNIIHRDIKPENILLTDQGVAKVADFGLARFFGAEQRDAVRQTQPGMVLGTPLYMSPEQVEDCEVDHRSDLYSLGVTAHQLVTGQPPFDGATPLRVAYQHLHSPPPPLDSLCPETPPALAEVVARLLQKQPENRFADAGELLSALREIAQTHADQWPEDPRSWLADERMDQTEAATRRLHEALHTNGSSTQRPARLPRPLATWALILGAVVIGASVAFWPRPEPLFTRAAPPTVERMESLEQQYNHAVIVGAEAALRAVWTKHEPQNANDERLVLLAKRRLARLLLSEQRPSDAEPLLVELSELPETESELVAFGLLGRALIAWEEDATEEAARLAIRALPAFKRLGDEQRERLLAVLPPLFRQRITATLERAQSQSPLDRLE